MMRESSWSFAFHRWVAQALFSLFYGIHVEKEGSFDTEGPGVILPKHQYWTDIPVVALSFKEPLSFVAKEELFRLPGVRSYLRYLGGVPLDRQQPIRTLTPLRSLSSRLKSSHKIVVFPEGTYYRGVLGPGKSRLIQMILGFQDDMDLPIPFIPVGIRYGERRGGRRKVDVRIGRPLFAEKASEAPRLTRRVMEEIGRLSRLPASPGNSIFEFST